MSAYAVTEFTVKVPGVVREKYGAVAGRTTKEYPRPIEDRSDAMAVRGSVLAGLRTNTEGERKSV